MRGLRVTVSEITRYLVFTLRIRVLTSVDGLPLRSGKVVGFISAIVRTVLGSKVLVILYNVSQNESPPVAPMMLRTCSVALVE